MINSLHDCLLISSREDGRCCRIQFLPKGFLLAPHLLSASTLRPAVKTMTGRLVQLKLVDRSAAGSVAVTAKAALVLQVAGENVSIENGALVRASSHRAWTAFQVSTAEIRCLLARVDLRAFPALSGR